MKKFGLIVVFLIISCQSGKHSKKLDKVHYTFNSHQNPDLLPVYKEFCQSFIDNDYGKYIILQREEDRQDTLQFFVYQSDNIAVWKDYFPRTAFNLKNNWCFVYDTRRHHFDSVAYKDVVQFLKDKVPYNNKMFPLTRLKHGELKVYKNPRGQYRYRFKKYYTY